MCTGCPRKNVMRLINNRTKAFCSVSEMHFGLDKQDPDLDFDILFFSLSDENSQDYGS